MNKRLIDRITEIRALLTEELVEQDEYDRVLDEYESLVEDRYSLRVRSGFYESL